ncbi:MAG TPA: tectonin domain-containing protein [Thermoanaerobaculia bacterium]
MPSILHAQIKGTTSSTTQTTSTIASLGAAGFSLNNGESFGADANTTVYIDGNVAAYGSLKVGMEATVTSTLCLKPPCLATSIRATTPLTLTPKFGDPVIKQSLTGPTWTEASFAATDIAIGANGHVWFIGADGLGIFNLGPNGPHQVGGGASRIAVDPAGVPWVVNSAGQIYRWTGTTWQGMPGQAIDIGIGSDGTVWVTGSDGTPHRWDGKSWLAIGGGGVSIAGGPGGTVWLVNGGGEIWQYGGKWNLYPGAASDIGVGGGHVFAVGGGGTVYRWTSNGWVSENVTGTRISVAPNGVVYLARGPKLPVMVLQ